MVPAALVPTLEADADYAIDYALTNGLPTLGMGPPTTEPAFVAAFVLGAVPDIAARWRPHLSLLGVQIRVTGVFVHGAPKVSFKDAFGNPQSCELADLLLVLDDKTNGQLVDRQAVLVQAKMAPGGTTTLRRSGDLVQYHLMSNWPQFQFNSQSFGPHDRDFSTCRHTGATVDCGRYGLIDDSPATPQWRQHAPAVSFAAPALTLGAFMADMAGPKYPTSGRPALGSADDWSDTVEELMQVTSARTFSLRTALPGRHRSRQDALAMVEFSSNEIRHLVSGSGFRPPQHREETIDDEEGISFVQLTLEREAAG